LADITAYRHLNSFWADDKEKVTAALEKYENLKKLVKTVAENESIKAYYEKKKQTESSSCL